MKKKQENFTNMELQNLKDSRSKSVPEQLCDASNASGKEEPNAASSSANENNSKEQRVETVGTIPSERRNCAGCTGSSSKDDDEDQDLIQVEDT